MHQLLFLEFIGTSELLVILVVALIIFGPRKLPELGRSLGQALHQMRGASEDFKRTWESEARLETDRVAALAPGEAEAPAGVVNEIETPAHETQADDALSYVNQEAVLSEV